MPNPNIPESDRTPESREAESKTPQPEAAEISTENGTSESSESFADLLSEYEKGRSQKSKEGSKGLQGTVIAISGDSVFVDIGYKSEGVLPLSIFQGAGEAVKPGDKFPVTVKGRNQEGYYELARGRVERPTDWASLEKAFAEGSAIAGTVTAVVKGGLSVDVGVRAFMPASRSGTREAAEMEKLVGQEIRCRITKLDVGNEDVVVDRRAVAEEEERAAKGRRYSEIQEGDTVRGTVRSLTDYGAFVDIGGVDALLHVAEISWARVNRPADVLSVGQQIEARVIKIDREKRRISLSAKQIEQNPWDTAVEKYKVGERVRGMITRIQDFGAFVELEPGIEGLVHISEMSWGKKVRKPDDMVKPGEEVEAVILAVSPGERRISLGLKQALGDPWADAPQRFAAGSVVEGPVISLMKFGAFVQLAEGVEGMIHIGDISADRRLNHPQDVLKVGQTVKAQVLEIDLERRRLRLGMKQLVPTSIEEYIAEHHEGDVVTGRITEVANDEARVELGEGVVATCRIPAEVVRVEKAAKEESKAEAKADLSSLTSMLQARWKGAAASGPSKPEAAGAGQVRSFRIAKLDPAAKKIELQFS